MRVSPIAAQLSHLRRYPSLDRPYSGDILRLALLMLIHAVNKERRMDMVLHNCPGPNRQKPNVPEEVECPHCGAEIEMWSHDESAECPTCGAEIKRKQLQGV